MEKIADLTDVTDLLARSRSLDGYTIRANSTQGADVRSIIETAWVSGGLLDFYCYDVAQHKHGTLFSFKSKTGQGNLLIVENS